MPSPTRALSFSTHTLGFGLAVLGSFLWLSGCGGGSGGTASPSPNPTISSVTISPSTANVEVGKTQQFTATVRGTGNFDSGVTWFVNDIMSGDSNVGSVDISGVYTAPANIPSPATVTVKAVARADTSQSATASVTIVPRQVAVHVIAGFATGALSTAVDSRDNIIVGNYIEPGVPLELAIASFDQQGNRLWKLPLGGPDQWVEGSGIATDPNQPVIYFVAEDLSALPLSARLGALDSDGGLLLDPFQHPIVISGMNTGVDKNPIVLFDQKLYLGLLTYGESGPDQPWLVTTDTSGNIISEFLLRDTAINVHSLVVTPDHILASGECYCSQGYSNVGGYLRKLQPDGTLVWEKLFDDFEGSYVAEGEDGSIYLGGVRIPGPGQQYQLDIMKLDQSGNEIWATAWDGDNPAGNQSCNAYDLLISPTGQIVLLGYIQELGRSDPNYHDLGALAVDLNGNIAWTLRRDFDELDSFIQGAYDSQGRLFALAQIGSYVTYNNPGHTVALCGLPACSAILEVVPP
jgi:hypothetical protein